MSTIPASIQSAANLDEALAATLLHFAADSGTIHLIGADGQLHMKAASAGIPEVVLERTRVIPIGKGMAGLAVERTQPITACNIQTDTSGDVRSGAKLTGLEGAIVVPMMCGDKPAGALGIANRAERTFSEEEQTQLLAIGAHLAAQHG